MPPRCCSSAAWLPHNTGQLFWDRMMQKDPTLAVETPQTEPEIVPPGGNLRSASRIWVSDGRNHTVHIQLARVGPVGMVLLAPSSCSALSVSQGFSSCWEPP